MKKLALISWFLCFACSTPQASDLTPAPSVAPTQAPTPTPTPLPSLAPELPVMIQDILISPQLNLKVNEEMLLLGDVVLSNGQKVALESVLKQLQLRSLNPELLSLDAKTRLLRAIKAGTAVVELRSLQAEGPSTRMTIHIENPAPGIDPNAALVDVEIF